jgi:hypothetical protein
LNLAEMLAPLIGSPGARRSSTSIASSKADLPTRPSLRSQPPGQDRWQHPLELLAQFLSTIRRYRPQAREVDNLTENSRPALGDRKCTPESCWRSYPGPIAQQFTLAYFSNFKSLHRSTRT